MFFQILFDSGYFTLSANGKIKIPNKEIKEELILRMRSFFETKYNINFGPSANSLAEIFDSENQENKKCQEVLKTFCNNFDDVLKICPPFFDIQSEKTEYGIHPNEDLVHSLLNVICYQIDEKDRFGTEICCFNQQRCDILITKIKDKLGVIIEVKFSKSAIEALDQIIDKKYIQELPNSTEMKRRILIGLNITPDKKTEFKFNIENSSNELI